MLEIVAVIAASCSVVLFAVGIKWYCWRAKAKSKQRVVEILHSINGYQPVNTDEEYV